MFDNINTHQKYSILAVFILVLLVLSVYWPVQNYEFINFDDNVYITENIHVQSGITLGGLYWAFSTKYFGLWNPLVWISFMIDYHFFGFNAGGYHWTNVILHIFNTILLFFIFRNMTGTVWRSAFVAALFAIHPINMESVAWIAERKNVLSTFFWMLTMLFYVRYVKQPNWKRYMPVFICFALGLMSKPMLVTLPFVLLLMDYWPFNRVVINKPNVTNIADALKSGREKLSFLILEKIPLFILSVISLYITLYTAIHTPSSEKIIYITFKQRITNVIFSYVMYLKKLFWPGDLSIYYLHLNVPIWQVILSAVILIMVTILVCIYFKKHPYLPVGWFWYLGTLLPVIGIIQIADHTMADRYAYVPLIGIFVMIAWGTEQISSKAVYLKRIFMFAAVLIIALFTVAAHNQIKIWTNTFTLFENALKKDPNNHMAYHWIGREAATNGENEKALYYYDMALKIRPGFYPSYYYKGRVLMRMGKRDEAYKSYEKAIQFKKSLAVAYYDLAFLCFEDNDLDKAMAYLTKAIAEVPDYIESYNGLGAVLIKKGRIPEAIVQFQKVLKIDPHNKTAQRNMRVATEMIKKKEKSETIP